MTLRRESISEKPLGVPTGVARLKRFAGGATFVYEATTFGREFQQRRADGGVVGPEGEPAWRDGVRMLRQRI